MDVPPSAWVPISAICTTAINAAGVYLFRRLIFKKAITKEERESIAAGFAALLESQQKRIDSLELSVSDNHASYMQDLRVQREECNKEMRQLKATHEKEAALYYNSINRLREEAATANNALREYFHGEIAARDKRNNELEQRYAQVLLQLRNLEWKASEGHQT